MSPCSRTGCWCRTTSRSQGVHCGRAPEVHGPSGQAAAGAAIPRKSGPFPKCLDSGVAAGRCPAAGRGPIRPMSADSRLIAMDATIQVVHGDKKHVRPAGRCCRPRGQNNAAAGQHGAKQIAKKRFTGSAFLVGTCWREEGRWPRAASPGSTILFGRSGHVKHTASGAAAKPARKRREPRSAGKTDWQSVLRGNARKKAESGVAGRARPNVRHAVAKRSRVGRRHRQARAQWWRARPLRPSRPRTIRQSRQSC